MNKPLRFMNCRLCGRFMTKGTINDDPENLEDEVWQWWYCANCDSWSIEHLYFKSEFRGNLEDE